MAANPARGEVALALATAVLALRPTYSALIAAEGELGSLFALIERAGAGNATLGEINALLWHCIKDRPADLTRDAFGDALLGAGLVNATGAFRAVLETALGGPAA